MPWWSVVLLLLLVLVVAAVLVVRRRRRPVDAEALAAEIGSEVEEGRVWLLNLAVSMTGTLMVFRGRGGVRMAYRSFRLRDHCPHCFLEQRVLSMLDAETSADTVAHYRRLVGNGQPVELHLKRDQTDDGSAWELEYYYPSKTTWRVVFPTPCDVHRAA